VSFKPTPGTVPPFQDLATLSWHVCLGESTIEAMVAEGRFPAPIRKFGKRLWSWKAVEKFLSEAENVTPIEMGRAIREATQRLR
jgi:hypothetical protein